MFSNSYQSGFISIFFSVGSNPLSLWDNKVKNGHIRRLIDDEVKSLVLEISGTNVATTYITCPTVPRASLGIKLPFFVMVIKNMKKYFTFEIQILDDKDMRRRFRVSNFQSTTKVRPFCTTMPIGLNPGWNQVQFNLADFTKRAYGSTYIETMRVQIHANVRIRRLYFTDTLYADEDMPNEFKLFGPPKRKAEVKTTKPGKEKVSPPPLEKPLEETPPPPSPSEIGPNTSPTGREEVAEEHSEHKIETPPKTQPIPGDDEEFPEGVELVPMKDVDDEEEMQFEEEEDFEEDEYYGEDENLEIISPEETEQTEIDEATKEISPHPTEVDDKPTIGETEPNVETATPVESQITEAEPTEEPLTTEEPATTEEPPTTEEPISETEGEESPE